VFIHSISVPSIKIGSQNVTQLSHHTHNIVLRLFVSTKKQYHVIIVELLLGCGESSWLILCMKIGERRVKYFNLSVFYFKV